MLGFALAQYVSLLADATCEIAILTRAYLQKLHEKGLMQHAHINVPERILVAKPLLEQHSPLFERRKLELVLSH